MYGHEKTIALATIIVCLVYGSGCSLLHHHGEHRVHPDCHVRTDPGVPSIPEAPHTVPSDPQVHQPPAGACVQQSAAAGLHHATEIQPA